MNKVCLAKVVIAAGIDMISNEEKTILAAVCDEDLGRNEVLQHLNRQGRQIGVYVCDYKEFGPVTEWEANEILMSIGIRPDCAMAIRH